MSTTEIWTVEQHDTEMANHEAFSAVLGVFSSMHAASELAMARQTADLDDGSEEAKETIAAIRISYSADGAGFHVDDGSEDPIFVYVGVRHILDQPAEA